MEVLYSADGRFEDISFGLLFAKNEYASASNLKLCFPNAKILKHKIATFNFLAELNYQLAMTKRAINPAGKTMLTDPTEDRRLIRLPCL
jgi:hypothetical protein